MREFTEYERTIANRHGKDAYRLSLYWAKRFHPSHRDRVLSAGMQGLGMGAQSALRVLGDKPDGNDLRRHLMRNVVFVIRDKVGKLKNRHRQDGAFEDFHYGIISARPDRLSQGDLDDLALAYEGIGRLPESKRSIMRRYYMDGLTLQEIGQEIGQSKQGVWRTLARAVADVRSYCGVEGATA